MKAPQEPNTGISQITIPGTPKGLFVRRILATFVIACAVLIAGGRFRYHLLFPADAQARNNHVSRARTTAKNNSNPGGGYYWRNPGFMTPWGLRDGGVVYTFEAESSMASNWTRLPGDPHVAVWPINERSLREWAFTDYDGRYYRVGWVRKDEISAIRHNRRFTFYSHPMATSDVLSPEVYDLVQVSRRVNIRFSDMMKPGVKRYMNASYVWFEFPDGHGVTMDRYTLDSF